MIYKGTLSVVGDTADPLPVICEVTDDRIVITASGMVLIGDWRIETAEPERHGSLFVLRAEGELIHVSVDEPDAFAQSMGLEDTLTPSQPAPAAVKRDESPTRADHDRQSDEVHPRRPLPPSGRSRSGKFRVPRTLWIFAAASLSVLVIAGIVFGKDPMERWAEDSLTARSEIAVLLQSLSDASVQGDSEAISGLCHDASPRYPSWRADLEAPPDDEVYRLTTNLANAVADMLPLCETGFINSYGDVEYWWYASTMLASAEKRIATVTNSEIAVAVAEPPPSGEHRPAENLLAWAIRARPAIETAITYASSATDAINANNADGLMNLSRNGRQMLASWRATTLPAPDPDVDALARTTWDALERLFNACGDPTSLNLNVVQGDLDLIGTSLSQMVVLVESIES